MFKAVLTVFLCLALFLGPQVFAAAPSVSLPGFTVTAPEGDGWVHVDNEAGTVRFELNSSDGLSSFEFTTDEVDRNDGDEAFLKATESKLEHHFTETGLLSRHYNYTNDKGVACLRYDAILGLSSGDYSFKFLKGVVCRLPSDASRVARLEAVRFANERNVDEEGAFLEFTDSVLQTVVFSEAKK